MYVVQLKLTFHAVSHLYNVFMCCILVAVVFTLGNGVNGFTLDEQIGEFILTHPNIKIPNRGKVSEQHLLYMYHQYGHTFAYAPCGIS
jgi:fructose-1,6-bisphosphatase